ncbi:MAG: carbon starvation protein A [Bdellovibrionaceae bacterium]|nr:carbon starvation protein A [Pseudobdellovibrionaceae bacterium]
MSFSILAILFLALITTFYFVYGRWLSKLLKLDIHAKTPAHEKRDGIDYEPATPFYLFAQHFSAIAAAGPIAGPILAVQMYGWVPAVLWISLGVVLIGAVHDFTSLAVSVKHGGASIAQIAKDNLGPKSGFAIMIFIWLALVYIIVAFSDITVGSFISGTEELMAGGQQTFKPGGAVASASVFYLLLSIILGLLNKKFKTPDWVAMVVFVPLAIGCAWLGTYTSDWFDLGYKTWALIIILYCGISSVLPVWFLLQPRGFLGGFLLYIVLILGVIGIFFGDYSIQQPAFKEAAAGASGSMFPFLFVTIACGACSGFHGIVCSGTTSKQIDKETHCHPIGYGAMLAEGFVALIAVVIVMMMSQESTAGLKPGVIYGRGIGEFLTLLIGAENKTFAITFGAMVFSTFVFDTLDVATRLARYLIQELTGWKGFMGYGVGTVITCLMALAFLMQMKEGSWAAFWTLFGASNQLLAALTLLSITFWLRKSKRPILFTLIPMFFVLVITMWALGLIAITNWQKAQGFDFAMMNSLGSSALVILAIYICIQALLKVLREKRVSA